MNNNNWGSQFLVFFILFLFSRRVIGCPILISNYLGFQIPRHKPSQSKLHAKIPDFTTTPLLTTDFFLIVLFTNQFSKGLDFSYFCLSAGLVPLAQDSKKQNKFYAKKKKKGKKKSNSGLPHFQDIKNYQICKYDLLKVNLRFCMQYTKSFV